MKLIDIEDEALLKTVSLGGMSAKKLWKRILSEREIEAIPISWLEKCNFTLKQQDNTTIPINFIIENLIDIWRKENESDSST